MRESRSYGSVGERGGDEPLYPESLRGLKQGLKHNLRIQCEDTV
jgi:hypothetical protein